jgi:hypothetical protein
LRLNVFSRRAAFALGILVAGGALIAGCGGGDSEGNDEDYVKAMCESTDSMTDLLGVVLAASLSDDDEKAADEVADAMEEWANAIDDANPPADAKEAHEAIVSGLRDAIKALRDGDADVESAFDELDSAPEPPQAVQDRLSEVAENTPECDGANFFS